MRFRPILIYVLLVGIPLLGIAETLRVGNKLKAPISIAGTWEFSPETSKALSWACAPLEFSHENPRMTVNQSGRFIQVQFNDLRQTTMIGKLDGQTLNFRQVLALGGQSSRNCGSKTTILLQLKGVSGGVERLAGRWQMPECASCPDLRIEAVRQDVVTE